MAERVLLQIGWCRVHVMTFFAFRGSFRMLSNINVGTSWKLFPPEEVFKNVKASRSEAGLGLRHQLGCGFWHGTAQAQRLPRHGLHPSGLLAVAAQSAFAASLLELPLAGKCNVGGETPDLNDVLLTASRLGPR